MKQLLLLASLLVTFHLSAQEPATATTDTAATIEAAEGAVEMHSDHEETLHSGDADHAATADHEGEHGTHHGQGPAIWSVIPFIALLLMIATGPLFYAHFWH